MSDRGLQSILSPAIQQTFGVGDALIGALHGVAGILVASALAMPLARLADRHSRKNVLLALIAVWTVLTAVGALSPSFAVFFVGRAASGITEFAMIPIVYSLIPDLVSESRRVAANLAFAALMATGASAGFYFGGHLLGFAASIAPPSLEPWRLALLCLSVAGLPLLALGTLVRDPPRGLAAATTGAAVALLPWLRENRRQLLLFLGAAGGLAIAVQAVSPLAALALVRRYAADLNDTGQWLGIITLATSLGALPLAGVLDRLLRGRLASGARPAIMGAGALLSLPCLLVMATAPTVDHALRAIAVFLLVTCIANALIPTMLQDLVPPALRARSFAIYSFLIAALCALGPLATGAMSDQVLSGDLLRAAMLVGAPMVGFAALCAGFAVYSRGQAAMQPAAQVS